MTEGAAVRACLEDDAPDALRRAVLDAVAPGAAAPPHGALLDAARERLLAAVAGMRQGRDQAVEPHGLRPAAANLLVADALASYALAAAVDDDVPLSDLLDRLRPTELLEEATRAMDGAS